MKLIADALAELKRIEAQWHNLVEPEELRLKAIGELAQSTAAHVEGPISGAFGAIAARFERLEATLAAIIEHPALAVPPLNLPAQPEVTSSVAPAAPEVPPPPPSSGAQGAADSVVMARGPEPIAGA